MEMEFMRDPSEMTDEEVLEAYRKAEAYHKQLLQEEEEDPESETPAAARAIPSASAPDGEEQVTDMFEWSEAIQRDMLNLCLSDQDFVIHAQRLIEAEYFTDSAHRAIFRIVIAHMKEYLTRPTYQVIEEELKREFPQATQYTRALAELEEVMDEERCRLALRSRGYIFDKMLRFAKIQAMKIAIQRIVDMVADNNWDDIEEEFRKALLVSPELDLGTSYFRDVEARYQRLLHQMQDEAFTLGFHSIDKELGGGLRRKEIGMVFAPPGVGKSLWLAHAAIANAHKGKKVLYVSLEMSEDRVANRIDAMLTGIPIAETVARQLQLKTQLSRLFVAMGENEIKIKEFPPGSMRMEDLEAYLRQLQVHEGWTPDMIVLDYIDEAKADGRLETYEAQMRLTRGFRGLMVKLNMAGLTATQSNRRGRDVEVITDAEIGDSYGKVRIVDGMWSINQKDDEKANGVARIYVVKHRNGNSRFSFPIYIDKRTLAMKELPDAIYEKLRNAGTTGLNDDEKRMIGLLPPAGSDPAA